MDNPLNKAEQRFDALLKAMASGGAPSARKAVQEPRKLVKHKPVEKPE
jgi:hypothetical protein